MKNYFYFSKSQKTGILVLLVILAVVLVVNESLPYLLKDDENTVFKTEAIPLREQLAQDNTTPETTVTYTPDNSTPLRIELNSCDTTDLQKLRGIGSVFSNRIIKYRALLGGFAQKEQLKEVYGFPAETYDEIAPFIHIDTSHIRKIAINNVSVGKLAKHPYLDAQAANAICEQREKLGRLTSENELADLENLPPETLKKILPYISFE